MAKKLALLTIHGMGETADDYYRSLKEKVAKRLGQDKMNSVSFHAINYQKALQPNQYEVWARMQERAEALRFRELRKFLLFGFSDAAGLENRKEIDGSVYEEAQIEIARKMFRACREVGPGGPVIVVAQSLGCQVFSSYIYDAQRAEEAQRNSGIPKPYAGIWKDIDKFGAPIAESHAPLTDADKRFIAGNTLAGLVTTGCNIPIFVAAHKRMQIKPIKRPTADFRWLNFYDRHDPLGWPLQPLRGGYESLVQDVEVNVGQGIIGWTTSFTPLSHVSYWEDDDVIKPVVRMIEAGLALL